MGSSLEPIPITSQKHDPAWKHCQMFKNGERVQLKCVYCGKIFKGGGIHRIKEHLAGQKGNAATCLQVPLDVRLMMQQSLDGVVVKKRKKQKIAEEITNLNPVSSELGFFDNDVNTGMELTGVSDAIEPVSSLLLSGEDGMGKKGGERKERGRGRGRGSVTSAKAVVTMGSGMMLSREPGLSRFATNFVTLKRMVDLKHNLQTMVTSQEWVDCPYSKKPRGLEMLDLVSDQSFWSSCALITHLTNPLLQVLRLVGSKKRPAMGYIYAGMYRAKEAIKKELVKREEYIVYWNIIDHWWEQNWNFPLHAADKIIKEVNSYKNAAGDFGRKMAVRARDTMLPAEWWSTYGGSCPNLVRLATRILGQTCSSIEYKRSQIPFEQLHDTKNCLERQRLSDLVFVQCNLRLRQMVDKNEEQDPISFDSNNILEDWIKGKELCSEDFDTLNWMAIDPPSDNARLLGTSDSEIEDLGAGFDDNEIFNRVKEGEEENVESM
ncbi:hypothetical protein OIU84_019793 [Salix udensis]|uniref:BED-type domain-containing protein n=1 Tax=Salix udensis TaxID=889485 RepID=A0AAD6KZN7_9ROSI|nr:hypothetical protein OIU84_019793 [Salix udensis]